MQTDSDTSTELSEGEVSALAFCLGSLLALVCFLLLFL